ncbi:MAG TPA: hypothetical protein VFN25_11245 [Dokdonella sp.]|uniref:WD40/YVTN/BNR-like repeat-containing protein n=1 Tax=Dokdonella sp. TaxID=2291710 RepID=UPI002D7FB258|nr:hypothetical protein [Dokdonella sp.]HET9033468.1 hypothetical protein [Dokdonella sp.]
MSRAPCITSRQISALAGLAITFSTAAVMAAVGSWSTTGPYGGDINQLTVYEAGPSTLFAAGRGGVFRSLSGGDSWQRIEVGLPTSPSVPSMAISTIDPVLYLATYTGTGHSDGLYRTGNAGNLWVPISTPLPSGSSIAGVSLRRATNDSIAIATSEGVYVSTNAGGTWIGPGASAGGTSDQFQKILFAADGSLYLGFAYPDPSAFAGAKMLKSTDGGSTWAPLTTQPDLPGIEYLVEAPTDPQRIFAGGGGALATSSDGGASWSNVILPANGGSGCYLESISPLPNSSLGVVVGCGLHGVHLATDINAPTWTDWGVANGLTANGTDSLQTTAIAVHPGFPATGTIWVGATDAGIFRTTNSGVTWNPANNGYQATNIRAVAAHPLDTDPAGAVILAGYGDARTPVRAMYKSSNGGASWFPSLTNLNAEQIRWITIDPTTVDANPFNAENFTVYAAGRSENYPLLGGGDGGIYKSTDAGASWTTIDNGIATISGTRFMGTVRALVLDPQSCTSPPCVAGSGPLQTVYVAGSGVADGPGLPYRSARVYKSTNAGSSWTASENGLPLPEDLGPVGTFNYLYSVAISMVIDPVTPSTLYLGTTTAWNASVGGSIPTMENGVFKSTDGGANWVHSSNGLPRFAGAGSTHYDVLALAINPGNPQILYAGATSFEVTGPVGSIYKSTDGGANWFEASTGIAGQDVRALFIDPADASGDTVYAGTGGGGANPGGVFRTTDGGTTWNSLSIGLPADAALALTMPPRTLGAPARIVAGTTAGVWEYTATPDEDSDGSPSAVEGSVLGGDGNVDGIPDATQSSVASTSTASGFGITDITSPDGTVVRTTIAIVAGSCTQLNDSTNQQASLYPPDPIGAAASHEPWGLVSFSLPACSQATVRVTFHGANFDANWKWRNYGPRIPGDATSFGWYSFAGAQRIDAKTWELKIDASRQGNYRSDSNNILFVGGPGNLPDSIFDHGFE